MTQVLFILSILTGALGVVLMVLGARSIAKQDFFSMAINHWWGVVLLTLSALITYIGIGDASYILMQLPFLIGAGKTWAEKTKRTNEDDWWTPKEALTLNGILLFFGIAYVITSVPIAIQMVSAIVISTALAMKNKDQMLMFLMLGRGGMFGASAWKLINDPTNAAALIWTLLMAWATIDNCFQLIKINQRT
ncbi:hypothetical protein COB52_02480 [Candidatus Kaiserbacteria bacterium]|nr:MAG: hypothetical protein COB52_02480 [Candidatus Kaiserbacteria bacterium]